MSMLSQVTTTVAIADLQTERGSRIILLFSKYLNQKTKMCDPSFQCEQIKSFYFHVQKEVYYYKKQVSFICRTGKCLRDGANMNITTDIYNVYSAALGILMIINIINDD